MSAKTILIVFFIFLSVHIADLFQSIPENGKVEVIDHGEYTFGVQDEWSDPALELCYYSSDTGDQGSFPITPPVYRRNSDFTRDANELHNIITTLGSVGLCQINVKTANETGPTRWTITIADSQTHNITSFDFIIKFYYRVNILEQEITVLETKSFYNHLIPLPSQKLVSCNLKVKDLDIDLKLNVVEAAQGEGLAQHISSLGNNLCGLKYDNVFYNDITSADWNLTAQDSNGNWYKSSFTTAVKMGGGFSVKKLLVVLGSQVDISCGETLEQEFCTLFNPQGETVVTDNCRHSINSFGVHHLGQWKCYSGNRHSLDTTEHIVEYTRTENPKLLPIIQESNTEITVGCKVDRYGLGRFTYCRLTAPNHKTFNVKPGAATERYTTIGTVYQSGICLVQIKKPLLPFENGYWRCEIDGPYEHRFGGVFLPIGRASLPLYKTRYVLRAELQKPFAVYCEVPYTSDYCYIKSPNGTIYKNVVHHQVNIGKCSMSVTAATPSDNGTWRCYFARNTGLPCEEILTDVVISDILHSYESVEVDAGSTAQLLCTSDGLPLSYCEYIAPNGTAYFIKREGSATNLRYYGRGLEYGDCGIALVKARPEHNGIWTCVVRLVRDNQQEEMRAKITVIVDPNINVAGLGIGIGVAVVLIGSVGFFAFRRWKRRRHVEIVGAMEMNGQTDLDNISNSSDVVMQRS